MNLMEKYEKKRQNLLRRLDNVTAIGKQISQAKTLEDLGKIDLDIKKVEKELDNLEE